MRAGNIFFGASVFALIAAGAGGVAAQQAGSPAAGREDERQHGAAGAEAAPGTIELDAITVTATRQPTQVLEVPGTVTVTTRRQLDEHMVRDNQDLVRYQPGINVGRQTSSTDPFGNVGSFSIRGVSGNRVQIQVDGTRVQEQITDGNRNFTDFPTMKAVEIVRGPGSVLWGADALGGIVAFRTLDPDDLLVGRGKPYAGRIEASFDSFNNAFSKTAMGAFQLTPDLQGILVVNQKTYNEGELGRARADGGIWGCPRVPDAIRCDALNPLDATVWNMLAKLVWRPTVDHEVKLTGEMFDSSSNVLQMHDYGRQATGSFNGTYKREQQQSRLRLSLSHDWHVGAGFLDDVRWQVSYSPQERSLTGLRWQRSASGQITFTHDTLDYTEDFLQGDLQLTSRFGLGSTKHTLTYGFQGDLTETDYARQSIANNLTLGRATVTRAGGFNFANATTTRADLYIQDEIKLLDDRLTVTPGLRWANYNIDPRPDADYVMVPGSEPRNISSSRIVPQVGALFRLTDVYSLYARYAEGFKMPTAQQLYTSLPSATFTLEPNPDLRPEKVRSYEGGVRAQFDNAWLSIGGFYADYTDFIQSFYEVRPNVYTYRNLSKVQIWGIEAFGEWLISDNWATNVAVSYQFGKQQFEAGNAFVPYDGAIPLTAVVGLKWMKPDWGLETEVIGTFAQGVTRASASTLYKPAGYAVFDAYANWKVNDTFTVRAAVLNIFDTRYFKAPLSYNYEISPTAATRAGNPLELQTAPGRTFKLSAVANF